MTDNLNFIKCPACGTLMKKVFLENQNILIDICLDGCGGIWLDNRELAKVDEKDEDITPLNEALNGKTFINVDTTAERICPICNKPMVKNHVSAKQDICIDECYHCGGKFFDRNELELMRSQYDSDEQRLADVKELAKHSEKLEQIFQELLKKEAL